jgi:hypothetical protein
MSPTNGDDAHPPKREGPPTRIEADDMAQLTATTARSWQTLAARTRLASCGEEMAALYADEKLEAYLGAPVQAPFGRVTVIERGQFVNGRPHRTH